MRSGRGILIVCVIAALVLCACNNFFHDLIPPDGDRILSFKVAGQLRSETITDNAIHLTVERGVNLRGLLPTLEASPGASVIPVTFNYIQAAFPSADILSIAAGLYSTSDPARYVEDLIRDNRDFKVPSLDLPIDFSAPVDFYVIAAIGSVRMYTVFINEEGISGGANSEDPDGPKLLGMRFSRSDNPYLSTDALCWVYEDSRTVSASVQYFGDGDFNFELVPVFIILGDRLEIGGTEIISGESRIQFDTAGGRQTLRLSVWRGGLVASYDLNLTFTEYWGADEPLLLGLRFAKYDNPELVIDSSCRIFETSLTISARAFYPVEMDSLSFALVPSFEILGESLEVDGAVLLSGNENSLIQFAQALGTQDKVFTVRRNGKQKDYTLTITFEEDPDTARSITDFRFTRTNNAMIAANAVASIVNTDNTGTITVQVFYEASVPPNNLISRFVSPGTVSVKGATQASGGSSQDFSSPLEYRVVSRNGMYVRVYMVRVEFISLIASAPKMLSFRFSQSLNAALVRDSDGDINDSTGFIIINIYYGGSLAPEYLIPEFRAEGIVRVFGSVQLSAFSPQDFGRQIKYTVSHPSNPLLSRDYWVQANMVRDSSAYAIITEFGFRPDGNSGLRDEIVARIDQSSGLITAFAPIGSGVTARTMYPYFASAGTVSVNGVTQSSSESGHLFDRPIVYTVVSANGMNRKNYTVEVRELTSTIYVKHDANGAGDGTNWANAFPSLSVACEAAASFPQDSPKEIWIARGTYTPWGTADNYFRIVSGTSYIGGFAGNETAKSERNIAANTVTLTGIEGMGLFSHVGEISHDVTLEDLRLNGGRRATGAGFYAVLAAGVQAELRSCVFEDCIAAVDGAAVYIQGGSVDIQDSVFSACSANNASAVYLDCIGETNVTDVTVTDSPGVALYLTGNGNKTLETVNVSHSGGIKVENSTGDFVIDRVTMRDIAGNGLSLKNVTGRKYIDGIDGQTISGNPVYAPDISAGSFTLANSSFDSCAAPIRLSLSGNGRVSVDRVTVGGTASEVGMELSIEEGGTVTITDSIIRNVTTGSANGALAKSGNGDLRVEGLELSDITGIGLYISGSGETYLSGIIGQRISGEAVYCTDISSGSVTLSGRSKFNNTGRVYVESSSVPVKITDTEIYNNSDESALYVSSGNATTTISNVTIDEVPSGFGIEVSSDNSVQISNSAIRNCAGRGDIGGIYFSGNGTLKVNGLELKNLRGRGIYKVNGGGLSLSDIDADNVGSYALYCYGISSGSITLDSSKFNNTATISINASVPVQVTDTEIRNNTRSPALSLSSGSAQTIIDNVIIDGVSNGGGIDASSNNSVRLINSTIKNCTTINNASGGGIYFGGTGDKEITNVSMENLEAGTGGAIYNNGSGKLSITRSRFMNCRARISHGAIYASTASGRGDLIDTDFINCNSRNDFMIMDIHAFSIIRNCTFTHDSDLVNLGAPTTTDAVAIFGAGGSANGYLSSTLDNCTFNNLKGNMTGENYLFCTYNAYPDINTGTGGTILNRGNSFNLIFQNCTFNFNQGSAGLMALNSQYGNNNNFYDRDRFIMDNCKINNVGGQQPLIWLNKDRLDYIGSEFQFKLNNYYNGILLDNEIAIQVLASSTSGVIRLTGNVMPVVIQ